MHNFFGMVSAINIRNVRNVDTKEVMAARYL